jgi:hypothetical protein
LLQNCNKILEFVGSMSLEARTPSSLAMSQFF